MSSLKIVILGCGAAAHRYYVPALKKYPEICKKLCLVDKNITQAEKLAFEFGGGEVFDDYKLIIGKVQGVINLLPNFLHYPISIDFLKAGVHVLCEKPLAESAREVRELVAAAEKNNAALCVNNTRRMFPSFQEVKKIISSGQIGKLKKIKYLEGSTFAWPSATGFYVNPKVSSKGVLIDIGPHVLDSICWWLGGKPELVEFKDDSFGGPESVAICKGNYDGCEIEIFLNRLFDVESRFEIIGEKGSIEGGVFEWKNLTLKLSEGKIERKKLTTPARNYPEFVKLIVENFIRVVEGKEAPLVEGKDVIDSISLIEESYKHRSRFKLPWYDNVPDAKSEGDGIILVTGATGFIGGRIVEILHLGKKRKVRAAIRKWSSAARLGRFPVDIALMDLMNKDEIAKALEGVTEIIHCAKGPEGVTVEGTKNLLELALQKGVKKVVHLSTTEVYGDVSGKITEDSPFNYTGNEYNKTKIDAEKVCWEYYKEGLPVSIIRPSIVYGPFSKNWTVYFAKMFLNNEWGIYKEYGNGKCNLVYIDDLVMAIILAMENESAEGEAFNITGPEIITWNEYFQKFNEMMGLPPLSVISASKANLNVVAMKPVRLVGKIVKNHFMGPVKKVAENFDFAKRIMKKTEHALSTTPVTDELKLFQKNVQFSSEKSKKILHFKPQVFIHDGIYSSVTWLKHMKIIS